MPTYMFVYSIYHCVRGLVLLLWLGNNDNSDDTSPLSLHSATDVLQCLTFSDGSLGALQ